MISHTGRRLKGSVILLVTLCVVGFMGIASVIAASSRDAYLEQGSLTTLVEAELLSAHADRSFDTVDIVLNQIIRSTEAQPATIDANFFQVATTPPSEDFNNVLIEVPHLVGLGVIDPFGVSTTLAGPEEIWPSDNRRIPYFAAHQDEPNLGVFVSQPFPRPDNDAWTLAISRRMEDREDNFVGVAVALVDLTVFEEFYGSTRSALPLRRGLLSREGEFLAVATPPADPLAGQVLIGRELTSVVSGVPDPLPLQPVSFRALSRLPDTDDYMVSLTRVAGWPLVTLSAVSVTDATAAWTLEISRVGIVAAVLFVVIVALVMATLRQITFRSRAEAALAATVGELEHKTVQLEQSNRELQDFAYIASHDLQEPLRKIMAFSGRLGSKFGDKMGPEAGEYITRMQASTNRMQRLIEDLLAYARVTTRGKPFDPVALGEVAEEAVSNLETRLEETGGTVEIGNLPTIEADRTQMVQLFQNLIGNAVKFRRPDVAPLVRVAAEPVESLQNGKQHIRIVVQDNGIGFEPKYVQRVFQPFQRLHGRGEFEGTGMGLAICRKIVDRHGGEITADSTPSVGTSFITTLPVSHTTVRANSGAAAE